MKKPYRTNPTNPRNPAAVVGYLEIVKITRDFTPIEAVADSHSTSLGGFIDNHLTDLVSEGTEVQDIQLHFDPEQWKVIASYYSPAKPEVFND